MTVPELIYSFLNEEIRIRIMDADTEEPITCFWKTDYSSLSPKWGWDDANILKGSGTYNDPYIIKPSDGNDEPQFKCPEFHKYDDAVITFWDIVDSGNTIEIYIDFEDHSVKHEHTN